MSQTIVSAVQPTGNLHLGNYLGAIKNWVDLQNSGKYHLFIFIADLHTLTSNTSAEKLREQTIVAAAELIAAGIDPTKTCLFVQSHVPEHAELAWVLSCVTSLAELQRMTQFKDKSQKQDKNINVGLLNYPVLMAADILLYKPVAIPVGKDQLQHLELTNDSAHWFNNRFGEYFFEIKPLLTKTPKIMSLANPLKKMSKSEGGDSVIELADSPEIIEKKIKKAVTATEGGQKSPGVENLLGLLKEFGAKEAYTEFMQAEKDGSIRYGDLKKELAQSIADHFTDFRHKREQLLHNKKEIVDILEGGAREAKKVAEHTMEEVRKKVGIR